MDHLETDLHTTSQFPIIIAKIKGRKGSFISFGDDENEELLPEGILKDLKPEHFDGIPESIGARERILQAATIIGRQEDISFVFVYDPVQGVLFSDHKSPKHVTNLALEALGEPGFSEVRKTDVDWSRLDWTSIHGLSQLN